MAVVRAWRGGGHEWWGRCDSERRRGRGARAVCVHWASALAGPERAGWSRPRRRLSGERGESGPRWIGLGRAGREWVGPLLREVKGSGPDWVWAERGEKAAGLLPLFYFYLLFPFKLNSTI